MVSIKEAPTSKVNNSMSFAKAGMIAFAATAGLAGSASAEMTRFADANQRGPMPRQGGVKKLPESMQPGQATHALVANRDTLVVAPPGFNSANNPHYGTSGTKSATAQTAHGTAEQTLTANPGRRLLGLSPFGGGTFPPPTTSMSAPPPPALGKQPPPSSLRSPPPSSFHNPPPALRSNPPPPSLRSNPPPLSLRNPPPAIGIPTSSPNSPSCGGLDTPASAPTPSTAPGGSLITAQLQGCPNADYSAPVNVGGQAFLAIADTGSTTFGVVSSKCTDCETSTSYKAGSSSKDDGVTIDAKYGLGEWHGELTTDTVSFAGGPAASMKFGAIYDQTDWIGGNNCDFTSNSAGPSINQALMGLGGPALLLDGTDSWLEKTNASFAYPAITFGLCDQNGALYLGGYPQDNVASPLIFTPMASQKQSPYVAVAMNEVLVGKTNIGATLNDFGYTIIDTGSTAMTFPPDVYTAIASAISTATNGGLTQDFFDSGSCAQFSDMTLSDLANQIPTMSFGFYNPANTSSLNTMQVGGLNSYLIGQSDGQGGVIVCPGMTNSGSDNPMTLLGNTMMRNFLTVFDYGKDQVGFAVSQDICKTN